MNDITALKPGPLVMDLVGTGLTDTEARLLKNPFVGGVILFSRNYESPEQLSALNHSIREIRQNLIIAVDQEGGRVQRYKSGFTRLPAMQVFGKILLEDEAKAIELAEQCAWLMASELVATGHDISFAPVLDVDSHFSEVIGDRAFSADPRAVSNLARAFIRGMAKAGMAATAKHFPGHGSVKADSHLQLPVDERSMEQIKSHDMIPFVELANQYRAVMPAHILFPEVDSEPVGYSALWLRHILRKRVGFEGVIFSDDLSMVGAAQAGDYGDRAVKALSAGCDAVLVCNNPDGVQTVIEELTRRNWLRDGRLATLMANPELAEAVSLSALQSSSRWKVASQAIAELSNHH